MEKKLRLFFVFLLVVLVVGGLSLIFSFNVLDYSVINKENLNNLGLFNSLLVFYELSGFIIFGCLSFMMIQSFFREVEASFYGMGILWAIFGFSVIYLLPAIFYMNNFMLFTHLILDQWDKIAVIAPDLSMNEVVTHMMDNRGEIPKKAPPMGGHTVVGGTHDGKKYVCVDIQRAVNESLSGLSKVGVNAGKFILQVPDVMCIGLEKHEKPDASK